MLRQSFKFKYIYKNNSYHFKVGEGFLKVLIIREMTNKSNYIEITNFQSTAFIKKFKRQGTN